MNTPDDLNQAFRDVLAAEAATKTNTTTGDLFAAWFEAQEEDNR